MPLTLDDLLAQPATSGSFVGPSGSASLGSGTTAGNTVLLVVTAINSTTVSTPSGFVADSGSQLGATRAYVFRRGPAQGLADGETSWTLTLTPSGLCQWIAYEPVKLDPVAPVDVAPTGTTATSSGTSVSTGTTPRSTTYDALVVAVLAAEAAGTTSPTFSGHTNGLVEQTEDGDTDGTNSVGLSVSMLTAQQLSTFTSTATCSTTLTAGAPAAGFVIVYSAEGAKREPNINFFWGFKVGAGATGLATGVIGDRYWDSQTGSPAITADGLQLSATAAAESISSLAFGIPAAAVIKAAVVRIKLRFDSALPSGDLELATIIPNAGTGTTTLRYRTASQKLGVQIGTGTEVLSDATVTAGGFISVELRLIGTTTAHTCDWQVDCGAGLVQQAQAAFTSSAGFTSYSLRLGWSGVQTGTVTYVYALCSVVAGHHPLGEHMIVLLGPDPAGTVTISGTTSNFGVMTANGTIAAWNATNARNAIDDWPPVVGAGADGAGPILGHATDYMEVPIEDHSVSGVGSIRAARVLLPMWAGSATAATCRVLGFDGTTATTLYAEFDPEADNTSTPAWICKMWRPTGGWTQEKLDAATVRIGALDATPDIMPHAVGMEVAVQPGSVEAMIGESGGIAAEVNKDPVTGGVLAVTVETAADQGATFNWEAAGVPGSQVVAPSSSHTETFDAVDSTVVSFVELVSDPVTPPEVY